LADRRERSQPERTRPEGPPSHQSSTSLGTTSNLAAVELVLTEAEMDRIAGLDRGYRLIAGEFWVFEGSPWTLQTIWDD
jgi:hypothetical protein